MTEAEFGGCSSSSEKEFLGVFFAALEGEGVVYGVMRNYQTLPYSAGGSDVDIYVHPKCRMAAEKILADVIHSSKCSTLGNVQSPTFYETYVLGRHGESWWGVCIEFYYGVFYKGSLPLIYPAALQGKLIDHNGIKVIEERIGNSLGFIKEILVHNSFRLDKPQYETSLRTMLESSCSGFEQLFSPLGAKAPSLLRQIFENYDPKERVNGIKRFRRYVVWNAFLRFPFSTLYKRTLHEFSRLKRFFSPPGTIIALIGVDGAGKSTLIDSITPALKSATHNAVFYQHLRPGLLPPLAKLKSGGQGNDGPVTDPHGSPPSGKTGSIIRLLYLLFDYSFGYWLKMRLLIAKRPAIVIFDRYAYDLMLDQRRFRISLPSSLVRFLIFFVPKPDLVFCLVGSPEQLAERKKELSVEEVSHQIQALEAFAANEPRAVRINTERSIEVCRDQILRSIVGHCRDNGAV